MPNTFVSPVILKDLQDPLPCADQIQRAVVRPHPVQALGLAAAAAIGAEGPSAGPWHQAALRGSPSGDLTGPAAGRAGFQALGLR
jgi:hypothetical protein